MYEKKTIEQTIFEEATEIAQAILELVGRVPPPRREKVLAIAKVIIETESCTQLYLKAIFEIMEILGRLSSPGPPNKKEISEP